MKVSNIKNKDLTEDVTQDRMEKSITFFAKKDFEIHHNDFHLVIKSGDELKDVPVIYLENLKTEGVL